MKDPWSHSTLTWCRDVDVTVVPCKADEPHMWTLYGHFLVLDESLKGLSVWGRLQVGRNAGAAH